MAKNNSPSLYHNPLMITAIASLILIISCSKPEQPGSTSKQDEKSSQQNSSKSNRVSDRSILRIGKITAGKNREELDQESSKKEKKEWKEEPVDDVPGL